MKKVLLAVMALGMVASVANAGNWITPSNSTCQAKGGKLNKGTCEANWQQAKNICRASGGRLPTVHELIAVITECGGNPTVYKENLEDSNYQSCYKQKGFNVSGHYWSSATYAGNRHLAWNVSFNNGDESFSRKRYSNDVRCVRSGQ